MRSARWIWSTLVTGAAILLVWGVFVLSFKSEPSAIGRVWIALMLIGGGSIGTAVVGLVAAIASRLREDEPRPCLSQEEALANAPAAVDGFFRVPSIQEET